MFVCLFVCLFVFNMLCLSFLVEACSFLLERVATVGLFRKPGSLPRIKTLRVRFHLCCFVLEKWCQPVDNFALSVCSRPNWIRERGVCPQPSPATWPLWSNSFAGSCRSLCSPRSSMPPCSKLRLWPTRRTGPQPSSCCPVCCLQGAPPVCTTCSASSPKSPTGLERNACRQKASLSLQLSERGRYKS